MKRKKTTKGRKPSKTAAKNKSEAKPKPDTNPAEVRREVGKMVEAEAAEMAKAVIDEAKKGQLAPMKYLFEMAGIYPASPDGAQAAGEEDSLAKILLDRLRLAATPVENHEEGATNVAQESFCLTTLAENGTQHQDVEEDDAESGGPDADGGPEGGGEGTEGIAGTDRLSFGRG